MKAFKFQQVCDYLYEYIYQHYFHINKKIPSERELSRQLSVSRTTVKYAIDKLVEEKLLYKKHGSGTYISSQNDHSSRIKISDNTPNALSVNAISKGYRPQSKNVSFKVQYDMLSYQEIFGGAVKDLYELQRMRYLNNEPYSIEQTYFPFHLFSDANRYNFSQTSLYDYMATKNREPVEFNKTIEGIKHPNYSQILGLPLDHPLFLETYIGKDGQGSIVEYTLSYVNPMYVEYQFDILGDSLDDRNDSADNFRMM